MNDEFLTKYHKTPRTEFADALYERISRQSQSIFTQTLRQRLTLRNSVIMIVLLFVVAACVYAVVEKPWNKVGGIWINVQKTYKIDLSPPVDFTPPSEVPEEPETLPQDYECFTIAEAREILRFDFHVPAWVPEGFTFHDEMCGIDRISDYGYLNWEGPDKYTGISIMLSNLRWFNMATQKYVVGPPSMWMPVAPGSYEEVQIHGRPAILVRGDWEAPWSTEGMPAGQFEFKWDKQRALQLYWVDGEVMYHMYTRAKVSPEDLIKMAESAR